MLGWWELLLGCAGTEVLGMISCTSTLCLLEFETRSYHDGLWEDEDPG